MKPNTCPNCGSGLTYYRDAPTEGICGNPDCVQHGEPQDYTMPLPDEAFMETKCSRCDKWDSECTCVDESAKFAKGGFVTPGKPYLVSGGRSDGYWIPKEKLDEIRSRIKELGVSLATRPNPLEITINETEARLIALGWTSDELATIESAFEHQSRHDYYQRLERMLESTKSGDLIPPNLRSE